MVSGVLVFDSSPLNHFARANELGALRDLVKEAELANPFIHWPGSLR
jgi:hypothetical protein